jgi:hypothetical protein
MSADTPASVAAISTARPGQGEISIASDAEARDDKTQLPAFRHDAT